MDGVLTCCSICSVCSVCSVFYPSGKLLRHAPDSRILRVIKSKLHARSRYLAQRDLSEWCVPMLQDAPGSTELHWLFATFFRCPGYPSCPSCFSCPWLTRENLAQAPKHPPRGGSSTSVPRRNRNWYAGNVNVNANPDGRPGHQHPLPKLHHQPGGKTSPGHLKFKFSQQGMLHLHRQERSCG